MIRAYSSEQSEESIVLIVGGDSAFSAVFLRIVAGQELHFEAAEGDEFALMDQETGSIWDLEGQTTAGPLAGESLTFVTSFLTEWYGWSAYHPETEIFEENS